MPVPHLRRGRLLPARRGARRARLAARAGRPGDSGAVVRALGRPPIELRSVDVARLTQLARRRKLDMPSAVAAALEGPQLSEEGRDRARAFLRLYRSASERLRGPPPGRLRAAPDRAHRPAPPAGVRHPGRHRRAPAQHREARPSWPRLHAPRAAGHGARLRPLPGRGGGVGPARGGGRRPAGRPARAGDDDARRQGARVRPRVRARPVGGAHARAVPRARRRRAGRAAQGGCPTPTTARGPRGGDAPAAARGDDARPQGARARLGREAERPGTHAAARRPSTRRRAGARLEEELFEEELFGPAEGLHSTFRIMRDELLDTVARVGGRLGEMRLDTYLDVDQAVARYLELIKVAALIERPRRARRSRPRCPRSTRSWLQCATPEQREILGSRRSTTGCATPSATRPPAGGDRNGSEPSLDPFIPRRGAG